jgi:hypothetical protein
MNQTPSFIVNPDSHITISFPDGKTVTTYSHESIFDELLEAIKAEDWELARDIIFKPVQQVTDAVIVMSQTPGDVVIEHGIVYVLGQPIHNTIADRILGMADAGFNIEPMKLFLSNLMENPSFRAVEELYDFLEATNLPITTDGHFLAYKKVRTNYTDVHSGKMDNSIGATVQMPRNRVNDNKDQTCSAGLHFCGRSYLSSFGGARTVVVKINPRDVVSIPSDYNNAKGRACKYVIQQELDLGEDKAPIAELEKSVVVVPKAPVITLTSIDPATGEVANSYSDIVAAASSTGLRVEHIQRVLDGDRLTTGGLMWAYVEQDSTEYQLPVDNFQVELCNDCYEPEMECTCCIECGEAGCVNGPNCGDLDNEDDTHPPRSLDGFGAQSPNKYS